MKSTTQKFSEKEFSVVYKNGEYIVSPRCVNKSKVDSAYEYLALNRRDSVKTAIDKIGGQWDEYNENMCVRVHIPSKVVVNVDSYNEGAFIKTKPSKKRIDLTYEILEDDAVYSKIGGNPAFVMSAKYEVKLDEIFIL